MRKIVRAILWIIKGTLLAIALAALVLWPWSYGHGRLFTHSRITPHPERIEEIDFYAAWGDGRIGLGEWRGEYAHEMLSQARARAAARRTGWQWRVESGTPWIIGGNSGAWWSPFGWYSLTHAHPGGWYVARYASIPCWLLAASAGAWAMSSLALRLRRHSRRSRLLRSGCCLDCGYDLRATPEAGGLLVGRCPECGTSNRAVKPREHATTGDSI
jgi:hypothetical protein